MNLSAIALRGIVTAALRAGTYFIVLDHLDCPSHSFTAVIREITDSGRTPVVAVARSPHMEDVGVLRSWFPERSDRFELRNFPVPVARQFSEECVRHLEISAQNVSEFVERVLEFSGGNPGAILAMLDMAHRPQYRSEERIKITPLYVDFRLSWNPLGVLRGTSPMSSHQQRRRLAKRGGYTFVYQIYKYSPPDHHELVAELKSASAAQWKVYQLDTLLTEADRKQGVFHYRWLRVQPI